MENKMTYEEALRSISIDAWEELDVNQKLAALKVIVKERMLKDIGTDVLCDVVLEDLPANTVAQYSPTNKQIQIRRDLIEKNEISFSPMSNMVSWNPAVDAIVGVMHEVRHAEQHYYFDHPDLIKDNTMKLIVNYNNVFDQCSIYFDINRYKDRFGLSIATCLYGLQPIERDAFEFAQEAINDIYRQMRELVPDDPEFEEDYFIGQLDDYINDAKMWFDSEDPIRDIDNIIRTINGQFVQERLNEGMCDAIKNTQKEFLYNILCFNQERNMKTAEKIERGRQFAEENEIDLEELCADSDEMQLYEDAERENEIGSLNQDDRSPYLSDRR